MTRGLLPKKRGRKAKDTVSAESAQRTRSVATVAIGKALEALGARNANGEKARSLNSALLKLPAVADMANLVCGAPTPVLTETWPF